MTLPRLRGIFLQISLLTLALGVGWWAGQHEIALEWQKATPSITVVHKAVPPSHQQVDFSLFWEVWDRLQQNYLDPSVVKGGLNSGKTLKQILQENGIVPDQLQKAITTNKANHKMWNPVRGRGRL